MKDLLKSLLAGIMIGIGATVYLYVENKVLGSVLFAIGLFTILVKGLNLFTGKIGYVFDNKIDYVKEVIITLFGNFIGTFLFGVTLKFTRIYTVVAHEAIRLCEIKLSDNFISIFVLSVFCGLLMYLAVNGYKTSKDNFAKYAGVFLAVSVFILSGFEHCIANMYYFTMANAWSIETSIYLLIMIAGNSVGSWIFPFGDKLISICDKKDNI